MKLTLRCQSSSCRHLKFSSLDGPQVLHLVIIFKHLVKTSISQALKEYIAIFQGVREHMLNCHPEGSSSPPCRLLV